MAPHSSALAWEIPWTEKPGRLQSMGSLGVGRDWATSLSVFTFMHWRRKWQPTPVFLPGESQGQGSLVGCCLWGHRVGHDWSNLAAAAHISVYIQKYLRAALKGRKERKKEKENSWVSSYMMPSSQLILDLPSSALIFFFLFTLQLLFFYIPTTFLQLDICQAFGPQFISGMRVRKTYLILLLNQIVWADLLSPGQI